MTETDNIAVLPETDPSTGLEKNEVEIRTRRFGFNEVPEKKKYPLLMFLKKFWGLAAWMLELIIILSLIQGKYSDALIVGVLLIINSLIGFWQEMRASAVVEGLKKKLQVYARVLRDGVWEVIFARQLVPGDIIRIRAGDFIPADLRILSGDLLVDQSALTGESLAVGKKAEDQLYSGSVIKRGEGIGLITRTGTATYSGRTTQLIQTARPRLHMEEVVAKIVRWLLMIIGSLLGLTLIVSLMRGIAVLEVLPLLLVLLLSAIPVALPVMFTVSMAVGARELARRNVLVTRLSATEDAATMDIFCVDKTGTLTFNQLSISHIIPMKPFHEDDVILYGALASQEANQDPLDLAFIRLAQEKKLLDASYVQDRFIPFDPLGRRTEAFIRRDNRRFCVVKGAVSIIAQMCGFDPQALGEFAVQFDEFSKRGYKTLAVAIEQEGAALSFVGLTALNDRPRPDSKALIKELQMLGVSIKMLTGDALPIAAAIADEIGIGGNIHRMTDLKAILTSDPIAAQRIMEESDGFAEVFPEDKYLIVRSLQSRKHVVGMTGDGVNDAPALKQAEVGIAVSSATDVAKAAASVVLTGEGLSGIIELVKNGRQVYQRIKTWVLNKIMRTILKSAFVIGVFMITGNFAVSASAMILLLLMTDFAKISLATDRVRWSKRPDSWSINRFVQIAIALGILMALESLALLVAGLKLWHLSLSSPAMQTYGFTILFFSAVTSVFVVRERRHFWNSQPSRMLLSAIMLDLLAGTFIAVAGIPGLLHPLPVHIVFFIFGYNIVFSLFINDYGKIWLIKHIGLS